MPTKELAIISARPGNSPTKELVGQHLVRLAELIRKDGAPYSLTPQLVNVWVDVFERERIAPKQIEAAFHKAEKSCKFWPSPADVLGFITTANSNATAEAAQRAWEMVLDIRRKYWCPDAQGGFYGGKPQLSQRVERACRVSGVFREVETLNDLHVWARDRFIKSFLEWEESEGKYLLPNGEIKDLLDGFTVKLLPWRKPEQNENSPTAEERLRIADELSAAARRVLGIRDKMKFAVKDTAERREELRQQSELIKRRYPAEVRA